jgi:uncharacterized protein YbcI
MNTCQKIGLAAQAFEKRRTKHGRDWVAVFMNEETMVIALHGLLTAEEKTLVQSPAGAAKVRKLHEELFASLSGTVHRMITCITGAVVKKTTAEIEPKTGRVVHIFTTDAGEIDFLQTPRVSAETRGQGNTLLHWREVHTRPKSPTEDVKSRDDRANSSERILR